jgi:putative DNA primase/helicase
MAGKLMRESLEKQSHSSNDNGSNPTDETQRGIASLPTVRFPSREERTCFRAYKEPVCDLEGEWHKAGVYLHGVAKKKPGKGDIGEDQDNPQDYLPPLIDLCFLSYLNVLGITRTTEGTEHSYLIEYLAHGETSIRRTVLPQSLLVGRVDEVLKTLRGLGVSALHKDREMIRSWLDDQHLGFGSWTKDKFWTSVKVVGWYGDDTFVLPTEIIGTAKNVVFSGKPEATQYGQNGSFKGWQERVATPCKQNTFLIFSLSAAFTGPLLKLLNVPGCGFQLSGDSTTGKSTALQVGGSAWGTPNFTLSWRSTANGLESTAVSRSDTITLLDESHLVDPKTLDTCIYMLLNSTGKQRMQKDISAREVSRWRNCVLSSGESSIEDHLKTAGIHHKAGQVVRIIDIAIAHGSAYGLFDNLHGADSGSAFSDMLRQAVADNYGFAGPVFVKWLIDNNRKNLKAVLDGFLAALEDKKDPLNPQEGRVARSFALVAAAGELAIQANILPWDQGCALAAVKTIFAGWRKLQPKSCKSNEDAQIIESISNFIGHHRDTRFTDIDKIGDKSIDEKGEPKAYNRAGFYENDGGKRYYLFSPDSLKEAAKGFSSARIVRALREAGAFWPLHTSINGEAAKKRRLSDGTDGSKFYHIDPDKLEP